MYVHTDICNASDPSVSVVCALIGFRRWFEYEFVIVRWTLEMLSEDLLYICIQILFFFLIGSNIDQWSDFKEILIPQIKFTRFTSRSKSRESSTTKRANGSTKGTTLCKKGVPFREGARSFAVVLLCRALRYRNTRMHFGHACLAYRAHI